MPLNRTLVAATVAALSLSACGAATDTQTGAAAGGGTLTVPWSGDVDSIDPGVTYYSGGYMVANVTQRTPVAYEPGRAAARPDLATALPTVSRDGRTVTIHLRRGVRFSPPVRRAITSADVKYAIERGFFRTVNNPYAAAYFGDLVGAKAGAAPGARIPGIATPDARTVVFHLTKPTGGTLAAALVLPLAAPVPRAYALPYDRESPSTYGMHQVASGPYMVSSYKPNREIDLVRNPEWRRSTDFRPAYLDKIVMPEGNDANLAARQVLQGSHMISGDFLVPPTVLAQAVRHHPDQLALVDSGGGRWTSLNTTMAPFDNADVRRAVVAGFNREAALMAEGGRTVGTVATHFLPPDMPGFAQAGGVRGTGADFLAHPQGDRALAAMYLRRAGYASGRFSGKPVDMVAPSEGNGRQIALIAEQSLENLGFHVRLHLLSQQVVMTRFCGYPAAKVQVCANVGWTRDFGDGETFLDPTFNGARITPQMNANTSQLDDAGVNAAIARAETVTAPAARARAWAAIDRRITALAPAVPLTWDKVSILHSADVHAVANENLGVWDLAFTSLR
jgi:peptide/nickel transport system substrate-binding protein